jgi:hypothetical protein
MNFSSILPAASEMPFSVEKFQDTLEGNETYVAV